MLLDTHVLLWWRADGARLSAAARRAIARADSVHISPVAIWEVATLLRRGRVALDRPLAVWVDDLLAEEGVEVAPLSPAAGALAGSYEQLHGDPGDRLLAATAQDLAMPLVTKDQRLIDFGRATGSIRTIW